MGFGKGGGGGGSVARPAAPDFGTLWQQYTGWKGDIGKRYESEIASTRARLTASGADPTVIQKAVSGIEEKRAGELSKIEEGATAKTLREGFAIAQGRQENPYATEMKGQVWQPSILTMFGYNLPSEAQLQPFREAIKRGEVSGDMMFEDWQKTQGVGRMKNMEEYYSQFYGPMATGTPGAQKTAEEEAAERAKRAASGATVGKVVGEAPTGAGGLAGASPWLPEYREQSPWM